VAIRQTDKHCNIYRYLYHCCRLCLWHVTINIHRLLYRNRTIRHYVILQRIIIIILWIIIYIHTFRNYVYFCFKKCFAYIENAPFGYLRMIYYNNVLCRILYYYDKIIQKLGVVHTGGHHCTIMIHGCNIFQCFQRRVRYKNRDQYF